MNFRKIYLAVASMMAQSHGFTWCPQEPWECAESLRGRHQGERGKYGLLVVHQVPHSQPLEQSSHTHICLMSFCHFLGLLVDGQQSDRLTAIGVEHRETKKMKAIAVISQQISREGLTKRLTTRTSGRKVPIGK